MNDQLKPVRPVIITLFVLLLTGALVFYRQRMLFLDAPHILFRIINNGALQIEIKRYGSFITQLFPYIGSKLHLPLASLMVLYSLSFNLFFATVALLLVYKYHRNDLAVIFALYLTLFVSDTYYWTNNEVHEGITWLILAFALNFFSAAKKRPPAILIPLFIATFALAIWTHPLVMIVAVYLWFFYWLYGVDWPYSRRQSILYSAILLLIIFLKYYQSSLQWYDKGKISMVTDVTLNKLFSVFASPQFSFFIKSCFTNYWLFLLVFISCIVAMAKKKKYLLLAWTLLFSLGYLVLVCITFWDADAARFYMESEYMPLSVIAAAPFVYFVLPLLKKQAMAFVLVFIFLVRLIYIADASIIFTWRMDLLAHINHKMKQKQLTKVLMGDNDKSLDSALLLNWGLAAEIMMVSKLNNEMPQRTLIIVDQGDVSKYVDIGRDSILGTSHKWPYSEINTAYFQFDTLSKYKVISYAELMQ